MAGEPTTRLLVGRWVEGGALTKGAGMGRGGDGICLRFRRTQTCGAPGRTHRIKEIPQEQIISPGQ